MEKAKSRRPQVSEKCIGCGVCAVISPDVFELSAEGLSEVMRLDSYEGMGVDDSISACPTDAIKWLEI